MDDDSVRHQAKISQKEPKIDALNTWYKLAHKPLQKGNYDNLLLCKKKCRIEILFF